MGKEIIKPTNPNREISFTEKAVRTGLVPLAIALTFSAGCSQEPSAPQAPVGISGNSSEFPNIGNDRPLQTLRATPTLVPRPTEKPMEQGQKYMEAKGASGHFSLQYPSSWSFEELFGMFYGEMNDGYKTELLVRSGFIPKISIDEFKDNKIRMDGDPQKIKEISSQQVDKYKAWKITRLIPKYSTLQNLPIDLIGVTYIFFDDTQAQGIQHVWEVKFYSAASAYPMLSPTLDKIMSTFKALN